MSLSSPTTRSRTLLFISYRDSRARSSRVSSKKFTYDESSRDYAAANESESLIPSDSAHVTLDVDLPPKWVDIAERIEEILVGTQAKISFLDKLHAKHVLPGFTDRSAEEREIESASTDITKDFRQCQALIQRIGSEQAHSFPPSSSHADQQMSQHRALAAKNVQRALAAKVQDLSATWRKKQRVYMEKLQGHAIKNQDLLIASGTISLKGSEGMSAVDEDMEAASLSQNQFLSNELASPDFRMRNHELSQIAQSISDLAELFKDLSVLVIDQGTLLDSVEYNIEQTAAQVQEAVKELDIATRYQKNTGRRKCIFLLLLIIFGLIMVLIFKPKRHASPPSLPSVSAFAMPSIPEDAGHLLIHRRTQS